jgi:hypothetical protein
MAAYGDPSAVLRDAPLTREICSKGEANDRCILAAHV